MSYYSKVTEEQLTELTRALDLIESVYDYDFDELPKLYLYGLTSNAEIIELAKEAEADRHDELSPEDFQMSQVVVIFRMSSGQLEGLIGSGTNLNDEEFVYTSGKGEGAITGDFRYATRRGRARITAGMFTEMALSRSDSWGDKFLMEHGVSAVQNAVPPKQEVQRTEEATTQQPTQKQPEAAPERAPLEEYMGKESSLHKVAYVKHMPGHKNSKGEAAPWVICDHKTDKILSSHKTEGEARSHLQDMHAHSGSTKTAGKVLINGEGLDGVQADSRKLKELEAEVNAAPDTARFFSYSAIDYGYEYLIEFEGSEDDPAQLIVDDLAQEMNLNVEDVKREAVVMSKPEMQRIVHDLFD